MPNLSQEKRQRMLAFLDTIRQEHKDDDDVLILIYGKVIGVGYRINGKWKSLSKAKAPVVTHWMSLPEPPKEE